MSLALACPQRSNDDRPILAQAVPMTHDTGYKLLFSHPEMVEHLLRGFVDEEWVAQLDFSSLERVEGSYVSEKLKKREQDAVWRLQWRGEDRWVYVYLLLEFQSTPDRSMALRMLTYLCLLYQDIYRQEKLGKNKKLPPVLPLVLYNGEKRWTAPTVLSELIDSIPGGIERYRPDFRYLLIDENAYIDDPLPETRNLVAALFALEQSRGPEALAPVLEALINWLSLPEHLSLRRAFSQWIRHVLLPAKIPGVDLDAVEELSEVKDMLAQRVKDWTQEWKRQGIEEGLRQGLEQGHEGMIQRHRDVLVRLTARRFGPAAADQTAKFLSSVTDTERLEVLTDRILDCSDADQWLALVSEVSGIQG